MDQGGVNLELEVLSWILTHGSGGQAQSYMHWSREVYAGKRGQDECPNMWALAEKPNGTKLLARGCEPGTKCVEWNHWAWMNQAQSTRVSINLKRSKRVFPLRLPCWLSATGHRAENRFRWRWPPKCKVKLPKWSSPHALFESLNNFMKIILHTSNWITKPQEP